MAPSGKKKKTIEMNNALQDLYAWRASIFTRDKDPSFESDVHLSADAVHSTYKESTR